MTNSFKFENLLSSQYYEIIVRSVKKMEQTETELVNKVITQETIKRQQEIMTKLLEHEKAEREKELDEKRQLDLYT